VCIAANLVGLSGFIAMAAERRARAAEAGESNASDPAN
jgi:hypothetical protein